MSYVYYTTNRYSRKVTAKSKSKPSFASVVSADVLWAAAAVADRINGGDYVKHAEISEDGVHVVRHSNRDIIRDVLNAKGPEITNEDFETGRSAREWHSKNLVIKSLRGPLSEFEQYLSNAIKIEEFYNSDHKFEVAVVASQIKSYQQGIRHEEIMQDIDHSPLAKIGDKVEVTAEVIKAVFSRNFGVHFITAKTEDRKMIFFSYRERLAGTVSLKGTVKAHRPDATQLNRVRLV